MIIVCHRGAEGHAPENTLLSFRKAIESGCQRAELDVRVSKDGIPVVIHDAEVDRTTDGHGRVAEMTLNQLKALDCGKGQRIPALKEVMDVCKGKIDLQIELKDENAVEKANDLILENGIADHVVISSFNPDWLRQIKRQNVALKTALLFDHPDERVWQAAKEIPLDYLGPASAVVTPVFVARAHTLGLKVYAHGVKDVGAGRRLEVMGVDEIGTPSPELFL